jgi:hypothetical protein
MWSTRKFIIAMAIAAVLAIVSVGGVVLAQSQNGDESGAQPEAQHAALLERVCEIYENNTGTAINAEELQNSFAQAQSEMREEALQNQMQGLVDEGKLTQEQADEYLEWWQSRPEDLPFGPGLMAAGGEGHFGGFGGHGGGFQGGGTPPSIPEE